MPRLTSFALEHPAVADAVASPPQGGRLRAPTFVHPYLAAALADSDHWAGHPCLIVAPSLRAAEELARELRAFLPGREVHHLPARGVWYGSQAPVAPRVAGRRVEAVAGLHRGAAVVVEVATLMEALLPPPREPVRLVRGGRSDFELLQRDLAELGYERVDQVEDPGQFSVRGGLIDVYSAGGRYPARVEFWGDEVESLRTFSPFSQRSVETLEELEIVAAAERLPAELLDSTDGAEGVEPAVPVFLPDLLPPETRVLHVDPLAAIGAVEAFQGDLRDVFADEGEEEPEMIQGAAGRRFYAPWATIEGRLSSFPSFSLQGGGEGDFDVHATSGELPVTSLPEAETALKGLVSRGYRVAVAFEHKGDADRAEYVLTRVGGSPAAGVEIPREPGVSYLARSHRRHFLLPDISLALLTEMQIFPKRRRAPHERRLVVGAELSSFRDLRKGDYVVHEDHGIGCFEGMSTRTVAGITRDYLDIGFRDGDMLYIPHDQIQKVGRYVGAGGAAPALSKLGGKAWGQIKSRVRKAVRELAGELLQLYALRKTAKGHVFSEDGEWQRRFERAFPYQETDDQLRAVDAVKDDMESTQPMDRLICGDVGYGKTEVALRAVFKAVMDSRQVMVLVPTTILAQQHYGTFRERFAEFPVKVEMLSRFRTPGEQRAIVKDFKGGRVDVLIGTHRLLSRDIMPKSLGLVVIDEEQRFGVAQKEALRRLKLKSDVLTLTATPIPRTLQMSLSGVRDISVIETPPRDRHPVQTYVGYYEEGMVKRAIEREVDRGGQVFYLHNRVDTIAKAAVRLAGIVPRVRIGIAHGQMSERELEDVMLAFLRGDYDVLVTTTIIESGLDIPNANTLIVERADLLGLSQLYQIRGRIGRSSRVAHAFLFHPDEEGLTEEARARLATLSDYTELGSGFKIAMRDLEIRGAGNLLGDEQSGHIAALGFEMYLSVLQEAVDAMQDQEARIETVPRVEVGISAYVPSDYVPYEAAKVDIHRRIAGAKAVAELAGLREELRDRFGPVPEAVENLMFLSEVRMKLQQLSAASLHAGPRTVTVEGLSLLKGSRELLRVQDRLYDYLAASGRLTYSYRGEGRDVRTLVARVLDDILNLRLAAQGAPDGGRGA